MICITYETQRRSNLSVTTMSDRTAGTDLDLCSARRGFTALIKTSQSNVFALIVKKKTRTSAPGS